MLLELTSDRSIYQCIRNFMNNLVSRVLKKTKQIKFVRFFTASLKFQLLFSLLLLNLADFDSR